MSEKSNGGVIHVKFTSTKIAEAKVCMGILVGIGDRRAEIWR